MKYFLVRFKGSQQNEIIDWNAAKEYAVQVMEFFGSRLKWSSLDNVVDETVEEVEPDGQQEIPDNVRNESADDRPANLLDNPIHDVEYAQ